MLQQNYIKKVTRLCQRKNANEIRCKLKLKKCRNFYLCVLESLKVFAKILTKKRREFVDVKIKFMIKKNYAFGYFVQ